MNSRERSAVGARSSRRFSTPETLGQSKPSGCLREECGPHEDPRGFAKCNTEVLLRNRGRLLLGVHPHVCRLLPL